MLDTLSQAQYRSIIESTARLNLWAGPVRSGKTFGSLIRFAEECVAGPPGNFLGAGKTERTFKRNIVDPLTDLLGPHVVRHTIGAGELRIGDRLVHVAGAHNEGSQDKIRGLTLAGGYGDEITTWPESFLRMLLSRLSVPGAKFFGTTNPDKPSHYLKRDFIDRADELNLRVFTDFRLEDNPALSDEYVNDLKAEYGPPGSLWYLRYINGLWVLAEGAIWSSFNRKQHTFTDLPKEGVADWWISVDYGTTNPFVALLIAEGRDGRLYVVREWRWDSRRRHQQLTDAEYSKRLREWLMSGADHALTNRDGEDLPVSPRKHIVDPSAASFMVQLWRDNAKSPTKANNAVLDGLRWTNTLFGADRLRIHESCVGLMDEIEGYVWDSKALERGEEKPLKVDDHGCLIAGTPVTTDQGPKPIEQVEPGDRALTRNGYRPVVGAALTDPAAIVYRVDLEDGRTLTGTGNHPVFADGQWVRLDALRYGMMVGCESTLSDSKASFTADTPTLRPGPNGTTTRQDRPTRPEATDGSTKRSGRTPTGRSLTATRSITSTSTHSTTSPTISSLSPSPTTRRPIGSEEGNGADSTRLPNWPGSVPPSGTDPTTDGPGIGSMADGCGRTANPSQEPVRIAESGSRRSPTTATNGSAPTPARAHGGELAASTTRPEPVNAAGPSSLSTDSRRLDLAAVRVLSVTPAGSAPVYNLTVADDSEYFANGLLVHNCDALRYGVMGTRRVWARWVGAPITEED